MHTPLAQQMVRELCADDSLHWPSRPARGPASLEARLALWDSVLGALAPVAAQRDLNPLAPRRV